MSFEEIMAVVNRLAVGTNALAAIGAQLTLVQEGQVADPRIASALAAVTQAAGVSDLDGLAPPQRAAALGAIRLFIREADVLLRDATTAPAWTVTDPVLLEGWGRGSGVIPALLASALPELAAVTSFLDVGVGVGWLAVAAAAAWPEASVVGIDVWEPSLERARANVAEAGLEARITLRNQDVTALDDVDAYDCAWVPSFFLDEDVLPAALERVVIAVRPGGTVVVGRFEPIPDPLAQATTALRTLRAGGCDVSVERVCELLQAAGCSTAEPLERPWPLPVQFVVGRA